MRAVALGLAVLGVAILCVSAWAAFNTVVYSSARVWAACLFALGMVVTVSAGIVWPLKPPK